MLYYCSSNITVYLNLFSNNIDSLWFALPCRKMLLELSVMNVLEDSLKQRIRKARSCVQNAGVKADQQLAKKLSYTGVFFRVDL